MYVIGDIGNTETKICLFNDKKKLLKKNIFDTNNFNKINLNDKFKFLNLYRKKIDKIIFSSVVPNVYKNVKESIKKKTKNRGQRVKAVEFEKNIKNRS